MGLRAYFRRRAMTGNSVILLEHLAAYRDGKRTFENAFQSVSRMILGAGFEKVVVNGRTTYDFAIFRTGRKHAIGMYDEINSFVSFVKDAAEGGSSKEMAFVLVGEPGNGKTFFVELLCTNYRAFLAKGQNRRYTFRYSGLDKRGHYGKITTIASQTYEDPMILAINLCDDREETRKYLGENCGFDGSSLGRIFESYRPMGACSGYIWGDIRDHCSGDLARMLEFVEV